MMTLKLEDAIRVMTQHDYVNYMNKALGSDWEFDASATEAYDWGWVLFYRTQKPIGDRSVFAWAIEKTEGRLFPVGSRGLEFSLSMLLDENTSSLKQAPPD